MNLAELTQELATSQKMPAAQVRRLLQAAFETIAEKIAAGEAVTIPGFGNFRLGAVKAAERHDPATGATTTTPAKRRPVFAAAKRVREQLNPAA